MAYVEILKSMCRRVEMDSCNFRNEGLRFFSRTALIILPHSFDFTQLYKAKKTQVRLQKKGGSIARKGLSLF